jgi:dTDP-L-rhamnose 4-epimerase
VLIFIWSPGKIFAFLMGRRSAAPLAPTQYSFSTCTECDESVQPLPLEEHRNNPFNPYAVSKLAQEKTALGLGWLNGIPTVALRYSITQGKRQSLYDHFSGVCRIFCTRALQRLPLIIYEDGHQTRDFVHVDDVVEANMLVLEKDEANDHAFNVGGGCVTTILEYARRVLERIPNSAGFDVSGEYRRGDTRHSVSALKSWGVWAGGRSDASTTSSTTIWNGSTVQEGFHPV